jgi:glutathione S-transferase
MTLTLHEHPFAAYCWKALVALFERDVPSERHFVGDEADRARLAELWPMASIPVLVDDAAGLTLARVHDDRRIPRWSPCAGARAFRTGSCAAGTVVGPRVRRAHHEADVEDRR